jgi:hypothetical protein
VGLTPSNGHSLFKLTTWEDYAIVVLLLLPEVIQKFFFVGKVPQETILALTCFYSFGNNFIFIAAKQILSSIMNIFKYCNFVSYL